jgi:hypothetical protein
MSYFISKMKFELEKAAHLIPSQQLQGRILKLDGSNNTSHMAYQWVVAPRSSCLQCRLPAIDLFIVILKQATPMKF